MSPEEQKQINGGPRAGVGNEAMTPPLFAGYDVIAGGGEGPVLRMKSADQ